MNNELQVIEQNAIVEAFKVNGGTDSLFEQIAKEARSHVPDVTTKKGRDAIGSLALKVSKSKTLIEKYGKDLVAEQKAKIKLVDDDRISVVKKLDELRNEILAPRDAWEQAEKDRIAKHQQNISNIRAFGLAEELTAQSISTAIHNLDEYVVDSQYEEYEDQAKVAKFETLEKLRTALVAREKYEAEQAELERLRQAEVERQKRENEERIAREATEAERKRIVAEQEAKAKAEHEAEQARLADQEHRKTICNEALQGLLNIGVSDELGKQILQEIHKGNVLHVSIKF